MKKKKHVSEAQYAEEIVGSSRDFLSRIYRTIVFKDLKLTPETLHLLVNNYVKQPESGVADNDRDMASAKAYIIRAIMADRMTFRTFLEGFKVLFPLSMEINFKFKWRQAGTGESYETTHGPFDISIGSIRTPIGDLEKEDKS